MKTTGTEVLSKMLHEYGVSHVFYLPCLAVKALAAMEDLGIKRVVTHSEKAAAYMADGFARASGRPGICLSQHIGASNLAAGLRDAYLAGSPVIALAGGPEPGTRFRHGYQDLEDLSQFESVTKSSSFVDTVDRLPDLLRQSFRSATTGAPGPVHLGFRGRIGSVIEDELETEILTEPRFKRVPPFRIPPAIEDVKAAVAELGKATRPVIVVGGGVVTSGAEKEFMEFVTKAGIPAATSLNAKHVIPDNHPLNLGVVGTYSRSSANKAVAASDMVFFIGSHTGGQVTFNWQVPRPGTPVIQLDIDANELGRNYPNRVSILGDAKVTLQALIDELGNGDNLANSDAISRWREETRNLIAEWWASVEQYRTSDSIPMRPERLCADLSSLLPENAVLVSDTGHAGIWTGTLIELRHQSQRYIRCAGSMGWGFPGAMGVKFAMPDNPVICFTGDGAFYYHLPELETAVRHNLKLITVVNNNSALSQEMPGVIRAYDNNLRGNGKEMFTFEDTDFSDIAESFGCTGFRVEARGQLEDAFNSALNEERPVVIDVVTDIDAMPQKPWV